MDSTTVRIICLVVGVALLGMIVMRRKKSVD